MSHVVNTKYMPVLEEECPFYLDNAKCISPDTDSFKSKTVYRVFQYNASDCKAFAKKYHVVGRFEGEFEVCYRFLDSSPKGQDQVTHFSL